MTDLDAQFQTLWRSSLDAMYAFVSEVSQQPAHLYPRQHFIREQSSLLVQDLAVKLEQNNFTAQRFREGIENLYYLLETVRDVDILSLQTLCRDVVSIINMTGVLVEYYEKAEGLKPTCWYSVTEFFKNKDTGTEAALPLGKYRYFRLGGMLGAGGFGAVYKAWFGNIKCVLKFVPPQMMPSMKHALADKQVACMINHPCLVKYYATFMTSGAFVTCMECIKGVDLTKLTKVTSKGLPANVVQVIVAQLGIAVQHLHFKGFIHRDVKPDNIMILSGCRIKLIDFDTCKVAVGKYATKYMPTYHEKTRGEFTSKEMAGTMPYMPPEAFKMTTLGRSMDWWAVGVITYELSTGRLPFRGTTDHELNYQVCRVQYTWPQSKKWSQDLLQFVSDCMNPDTSTRLCSRQYSDFQGHSYFKNIDFHQLETAPVLLQYNIVDELIQRNPALQFDNPGHMMCNSPGTEQRRARLFPNMNFKDLNEQQNMYCYSSNGFIRCIDILKSGKTPNESDIRDEHEFLNVEDDYGAPYVFENFTKEVQESSSATLVEEKPKTIKPKRPKKPIEGLPIDAAKFMSFVKRAPPTKQPTRQPRRQTK